MNKWLKIAACISFSGACIGVFNVAYAATFEGAVDLIYAGFWMTVNAGCAGFWVGKLE